MSLDPGLKRLLGLISTVEDEARSDTRSEADRALSRAKLLSTLEALPVADGAPSVVERRGVDQFVLEQLHGLLGPTAARRALELVGTSLGRRPEALTWDACEAVGAALRPILTDLVGAEIAGSVAERICLGRLVHGGP